MPGSPLHTVTYAYQPNEPVWVIIDCGGTPKVEGATIIRVRIEILVTATTKAYDVQLDSAASGTEVVDEVDIFGSLDEALAEYQTRLEAL